MENYKEITFDEAMGMIKNRKEDSLFYKYEHSDCISSIKGILIDTKKLRTFKWFKKTTNCNHPDILLTKSGDGTLLSRKCVTCGECLFKGAMTDDDPIKPEVSG
ncbi:hypothetical protein [Paenilisteria newyorkensis]|uniref:hypothetical protein n=1 Tax=Listeria newyorkensis TaxID=1497681 RepID=UPI00235909B6|nr:hypothetical protein [Listeria newyorkensis]WAO22045.1 hypothetical protein OTR81_01760 [Listeria newyorkensis]